MNETNSVTTDSVPVTRSPLAQELIWTLGCLLTGLLVLPALIYAVGSRMFGAYKGVGSATGLSAFYADYAHDIAGAHLTAWTLAIGPLLLVYLVRLILGHVPLNTSWLHQSSSKETDSSD